MGRSVPTLGKAASASQASLALAAMGGALSARALQAVAGVRGSGGAGPGSVGSAGAIGDATDASRGKGSQATGNRPGFASVLARIATSRVSRGQSETRDSIVAGLSAQPLAAPSDSSGVAEVTSGAMPAPTAPVGRSASMSSTRRDAAAGMRAVGRLQRALDRARSMTSSDGSNPAAGSGMRPIDATPSTPQTSGRDGQDGNVGGADANRGGSFTTPEAAVTAVDDAAARVEAAVATGDASTVAAVVADVSKSVPDSIRVLLGQAAVALAGDGGALDLGMLMVGAFDGSVADLPTLSGTAADQTSLAGLLVALRQVGATLEIGGAAATAAATPTTGVSLDGAGVFAALASVLASAAADEASASASAAAPTAGPASPTAAVAVATQTATDSIATPALSDVQGAPVIAVAEAGVATVVPIVARASGNVGHSSATGSGVAAEAANAAAAGADGSVSSDSTTAAVAAVASLTGAAGAGAGDGDEAGGPVAQGTTTAAGGSAPITGAGVAPEARIRNADATGIASTTTHSTPDAELHEQVSPVLVRLAKLTGVGEARQFTLRLNPDNLGPLAIRLTLRQGAIGVDLTTASPEARKALESALPQLRASLQDAGLRLERLDVGLRDRSDDASGRNAGRQPDQSPQRQPGDPGQQAGSGTGDGGREWAATFFGRLQFDQDGRPFEVPASTPDASSPVEIAPPSREFVRSAAGTTEFSVTRALGVQSRVSVGIGAYGGRRAVAAMAATGGEG